MLGTALHGSSRKLSSVGTDEELATGVIQITTDADSAAELRGLSPNHHKRGKVEC